MSDEPTDGYYVVFLAIVIQVRFKQVNDGILVVRECGVGTPFEPVPAHIDGIQCEFDSLIVDLTDIGENVIISCHCRDRSVYEQVMGVAVVSFNSSAQTASEQVEANGNVGGIGRCRFQIVVTDRGGLHSYRRAATIPIHVVCYCREAKRLIRTNGLVTSGAIRYSELQHIYDAHLVEEVFIRNKPCRTHRGECCKLVVSSEYRASVAAGRQCYHVSILKAVIKSRHRGDTFCSLRAG